MKKLIPLLILTLSTHAAAEVINCPTSKNFTFQEKKWKLLVDKDTREETPPYNYGKDFYNYDPWLHIIEGHPTKGIYGMTFEYNTFSSRAAKDKNGITLQCNGTYASNECSASWWSACRTAKGNIHASLSLDNNYKFCMPISSTSFDCEK